MHRVLFVVTSNDRLGASGLKTGYSLPEVRDLVAVLSEFAIGFDFASPLGGQAPLDESTIKAGDIFRAESASPNIFWLLDQTLSLATVNTSLYRGVILVGGPGALGDFPGNKDLQRVMREVYQCRRGIVAAIGYGVAGLLEAKLSTNDYILGCRYVTGLSNFEEELMRVACGGKQVSMADIVPFSLEKQLRRRQYMASYTSAKRPFDPQVVVSGRVITAQNSASAHELGLSVTDALRAVPS